MKEPLVTVSIPTLNSAPFLDKCLTALSKQSYKNIEINIVDGGSSDDTLTICKKHNIDEIIICNESLLKSRAEGVKPAKGRYILLLDSDQVLEPNAIAKAVHLAEHMNFDMLVLEEDVYSSGSWLEKLFQLDRKLIHEVKDFSPYTGVMLPRFYRIHLLNEAISNIPKNALNNVGGQDHAIIYFEAWQISQSVGFVPHAVKHIEPNSVIKLVQKFYRWGYTSSSAHNQRYTEMLSRKERFRGSMFRKGLILASLGSICLLLLKGVPYYSGYLHKRLAQSVGHGKD